MGQMGGGARSEEEGYLNKKQRGGLDGDTWRTGERWEDNERAGPPERMRS